VGHVVHSGVSEAQNVATLFFMLGWVQYGFDNKRYGTRYTELMFLHLVGYAGHIVYSGVFRVRNVNTLFSGVGGTGTDWTKSEPGHVTSNLYFCIRWDLRVT
jgi:hypothetical protein